MAKDQNDFLKYLADTVPQLFAEVLAVAKEYAKKQQGTEVPESTGGGPAQFKVGGETKLTTIPITDEQMDAIAKNMAEGFIKEKALEWIKGFITGATMSG